MEQSQAGSERIAVRSAGLAEDSYYVVVADSYRPIPQ